MAFKSLRYKNKQSDENHSEEKREKAITNYSVWRKSRSKARELCEKQHVYWLCVFSLSRVALFSFVFVAAGRLELM